MTGYCEVCQCEQEAVLDEYGADVCPQCDCDLLIGYTLEEEEEAFDDWLMDIRADDNPGS